MEIITIIGTQIEWYKKFGDTATIEKLLTLRDRLVVNLWTLGQQSAECKTLYNKTRFIYKISVCRCKKEFTDKKMPVNKAEIEALLENEQIYESELETEAMANMMDILLSQGNMVSRAIEQRISYMKKEKEQSNNSRQIAETH